MSKFVCKHPWTHFEVNNPNGSVMMCCNNSMAASPGPRRPAHPGQSEALGHVWAPPRPPPNTTPPGRRLVV